MRITNDNINTACRNIAIGIGCGGLLLIVVIAAVGAWVVVHGG